MELLKHILSRLWFCFLIRKKIFSAFFVLTLFLAWQPSVEAGFSDMEQHPMYSNYLEIFQKQNVIIGDTEGGEPTGTLRPTESINRAEFAKVAVLVRILEELPFNNDDGGWNQLLYSDLNDFTFYINKKLQPYYQPINGSKDFIDVEQKDEACASNPTGCQPWYTEYVNYASSQGMIAGYDDGSFKPNNPILRIHSLKLIMANDGNISAIQDSKFQSLASSDRISLVHKPKCLEGAENYILNNNGGDNQNSRNLLDYAILADKLDLFGSGCQIFTEAKANTPKERADFLQKPLTRQEIARYFSLTTSHEPLQFSNWLDPTTSTKEENGMTYYDPNYEVEWNPLAEEKLCEINVKCFHEDDQSPNGLLSSGALNATTGIASYVCKTHTEEDDCMTIPSFSELTLISDFKTGRYSSDGKTNQWIQVRYENEAYWIFLRSINGTGNKRVDAYIRDTLNQEIDPESLDNYSSSELMEGGFAHFFLDEPAYICDSKEEGAACELAPKGSKIILLSSAESGRYSNDQTTNKWLKVEHEYNEYWMLLRNIGETNLSTVNSRLYILRLTDVDKRLYEDHERGPEFWYNEIWSPYDDWMTVSYETGNAEREAGLFEFIKENKQMFIDVVEHEKIKGKVSPPLVAAIMWDEIVGSGFNGSTGYGKDDFRDETNTQILLVGESYGPFQVKIATATEIINDGYAQAPKDYESFFNSSGELHALGNKKMENLMVKFQFSIELAAGRLAQIVDHWDRPGGSDLKYVDNILGVLYSWNLSGSGVDGDPGTNERSLKIAEKSLEFNELIFNGLYEQRNFTPILD